MQWVMDSNAMEDFLQETEEVDYSHLSIRELAAELASKAQDELDLVKRAFEFVRDEIAHSWDIRSRRVTRRASEVLHFKEGICYAKSNLLCAILRGQGIPAGYSYQRLTLGDTPDTGYCIHALNAVYLKSLGSWIRLDARGNKEGIQAEFSTDKEQLAFPIRESFGEKDYATIFSHPHPITTATLKQNTDCMVMYQHGLPSELLEA
jgi:transglutaminase-like putative cysteine protease